MASETVSFYRKNTLQSIALFIILTLGLQFSAQAENAHMQCASLFSANGSGRLQQQAEFYTDVSIEYQKLWNQSLGSSARSFLLDEKRRHTREAQLLEKFGFEFSETTVTAPRFDVFERNYKLYLDELKVPIDQRIYPSLGLRSSPSLEVVLVSPTLQNWPEALSKFSIHPEPRQNQADFARSVAHQQYPTFAGGIHDLYHFITFALYPRYSKIILDTAKKFQATNSSSSFKTRNAYFIEVLTLANPDKLEDIVAVIENKNIGEMSSITDFEDAIKKLSEDELVKKAAFWQNNFQSYLNHYAGGTANPDERQQMSMTLAKFPATNTLKHFYGGRDMDEKKTLSIELINDGISQMDSVLGILLNVVHAPPLGINYHLGTLSSRGKLEVLRLIRLQVARMEYTLWKTATQIDLNQWAADTLNDEIDVNSQTMKFIKDILGENSITYRKFTRRTFRSEAN